MSGAWTTAGVGAVVAVLVANGRFGGVKA